MIDLSVAQNGKLGMNSYEQGFFSKKSDVFGMNRICFKLLKSNYDEKTNTYGFSALGQAVFSVRFTLSAHVPCGAYAVL